MLNSEKVFSEQGLFLLKSSLRCLLGACSNLESSTLPPQISGITDLGGQWHESWINQSVTRNYQVFVLFTPQLDDSVGNYTKGC